MSRIFRVHMPSVGETGASIRLTEQRADDFVIAETPAVFGGKVPPPNPSH